MHCLGQDGTSLRITDEPSYYLHQQTPELHPRCNPSHQYAPAFADVVIVMAVVTGTSDRYGLLLPS